MTREVTGFTFSLYMICFFFSLLFIINLLKIRKKNWYFFLILPVLFFLYSWGILCAIRRMDYGLSLSSFLDFMIKPYIAFPIFSILFFLLVFFTVFYKRGEKNVNPHSIYTGINTLKSGYCVFKKSGFMLMVNEKMDELSYMATGEYLYNGLRFKEFLEEKKNSSNEIKIGTSWYTCRIRSITAEKKELTEIILSDITSLHELNERLMEEKERRYEYQRKLKSYSKEMEHIIKEEEILSAKTKIHAEFGNLLLEGKYSLSHKDEREAFLKNAGNIMELTLVKKEQDTSMDEIMHIAKSLGVNLSVDGKIEEFHSEAIYRLLQESITNSRKHADAKNLYLEVRKDGAFITYTVFNDGKAPDEFMSEGGGLSSVRRITESLGGEMSYSFTSGFKIILRFKEVLK